MKYFTKEYYRLLDESLRADMFEISSSARKKSERYFQSVYERRLNNLVNAQTLHCGVFGRRS